MITLSLDTSHPVGSVSLARDGELLGSETFGEPSSHLVALGHALDQLLASTALTPAGIDRLAVVTGPGSFTGLRIADSNWAKGGQKKTRIESRVKHVGNFLKKHRPTGSELF